MTSDERRATRDKIDEADIEEKLKSILSGDDYKHALRTRAKAEKLARIYGVDVGKARLAGLLHDYGRHLAEEELFEHAGKLELELDPVERKFLMLLHGPVGARLVLKDFHLDDEEILQAIALHTVGSPVMASLDKVIYLADKLELGREHEGAAHLRSMIGQATLDELFKEAYLHSMTYVLRRGGMLHPSSVEIWNSIVR